MAVASAAQGPFKPVKTLLDNDYAFIDPHLFRDQDGALYLVYKERLAGNGKTWERQVVEQPFLYREGDTYVLFYSGAGGADESYAIGVATSRHPLGPYRKNPATPGCGPAARAASSRQAPL